MFIHQISIRTKENVRYTLGTHGQKLIMFIGIAFGWLGGTIFTQFSILLRDLRRATRLEAKVSVFDLGPRSIQ
jgi:hypothetical protein